MPAPEQSCEAFESHISSTWAQAAGGVGGAVEDSAGQVAKDADPAAKRAKEVGHSVADDAAEGAEGARGKAKGKATELKGQVGGLAPPRVLMFSAEVGTQEAPD